MNKYSHKEVLRVQPLYSIFVYIVASISLIAMLFLPMMLSWEITLSMVDILYFITMAFLSLCAFLLAVHYMQYAILSETGIVIKNPFGEIVRLEWKEITSIRKEDLITYHSSTIVSVSLEWLVVRTDEGQIVVKGGKNKKSRKNRKSFYQLISTHKNISIIKTYAQQYCIPICID